MKTKSVSTVKRSWSASKAGWCVMGLYGIHSFTSLAYEVVWIKLITASLGMTLAAMGLVLTVFVAGLGCGPAILAWWVRRRPLSIRWSFVVMQGALCLWGGMLPYMLGWVDLAYIAMATPDESILHHVIRLAAGFFILFPPACLIGAVFPLLGESISLRQSCAAGRSIGWLYMGGLVCSGIGAVTAPFWLVPWLGLTKTCLLLGALNGLSALIGINVFQSFKHQNAGTRPNPPNVEGKRSWKLFSLSAILGFYIFAIEVIGAKYIWLIVDSTVYTEGILMGIVLFSMAGGSMAYLGLRKCGIGCDWLLFGGILALVIAPIIWITQAAHIGRLFIDVIHHSAWTGFSVTGFFAAHGMLVLAVLGAPAFAAGLIFPGLCEWAVAYNGSIAGRMGRLVSWHYLGSGIGAAGIAFVLLPTLGLTRCLILLSITALIAAAGFFTLSISTKKYKSLVWGFASAMGAIVFWLGGISDVTFRTEAADHQNSVVFHHEDSGGVVEVYEEPNTGYRTLLSSRLRQEGADRPRDLRVQRLQGSLPVLLHPVPRKVLVIGLGTGISPAAALRSEVEQLTCVEVSRGVIRAASLFVHANNGILQDKRVRLIEQDGRNFLKLTREHYDLIIQDLFFPYRSGVGNLYTKEHYTRVRNRLAPGGHVGQWIALNQVGPLEFRSLIRTFSEVFPFTSLWLNGGYLLLYVGMEPFTIDWPAFRKRFITAPPVKETNPADYISMFVSSDDTVHRWAATAPINTDDNAFIEYRASRALKGMNSVTLAVENLSSLISLHKSVVKLAKSISDEDQEKLVQCHKAASLLWEGIVARARGELNHARRLYAQAYALNPFNFQVKKYLEEDMAARGRQALLEGRVALAKPLLQHALVLNAQNPDAKFDLAMVHTSLGEDAPASIIYKSLLQEQPEFPHLRFNLGVSQYRLGQYNDAAKQFEEVVAVDPTSVDALFNLANSLAQLERYHDATKRYRQILLLDPDHQLAKENLKEILEWLRSNQPER